MNAQQLDKAFEAALNMPAETPIQHFQRTVAVSNVKHWLASTGNYYPAMDAKQRAIFDDCELEAREVGIERG